MNIGKPIANVRVYILDSQLQLQAPGIAGELCIAGISLARGYLNLPELTNEKFIELGLFGKWERVYKTGDLARWLPEGKLEFLGRIDTQIKLRGQRIEFGEIEAELRQHPSVKEAVVNLYEADGTKHLVAYLTEDRGDVLIADLRLWLKTRLPDYMIPSYFMVIDSLPLTPNGKIDRKALPELDKVLKTDSSLPRDAIELQLLAIWEVVLDIHPLGIHDNFFDLGGHSLLVVKLMSIIHERFNRRIPVSALFQHATVADLAVLLRQDSTPVFTNLVPMQTAINTSSVFCLPGILGSVMYLYPLASSLGQCQRFYGLQTPGLDGLSTPETVEDLAKYHIQALQQLQSTEPYQLMGHSAGGVVAFEMARQLEQQGETVALLVILDTCAPVLSQSNPYAHFTELNWLAKFIADLEIQEHVDLNLSLLDLQALPNLETAYETALQRCQGHEILFAPKSLVDELKATVRTYSITLQAHCNYRIHGKLRCPIHLFRATEVNTTSQFEDTRKNWGWAEYTNAEVTEHSVPGTHINMMQSPHVKTLANELAKLLLQN